jgi:hypothetical protein
MQGHFALQLYLGRSVIMQQDVNRELQVIQEHVNTSWSPQYVRWNSKIEGLSVDIICEILLSLLSSESLDSSIERSYESFDEN